MSDEVTLIFEYVCNQFEVNLAEIRGVSREGHITRSRKLACVLLAGRNTRSRSAIDIGDLMHRSPSYSKQTLPGAWNDPEIMSLAKKFWKEVDKKCITAI